MESPSAAPSVSALPTIVSTESFMPTIVSTESDMPTIVSTESDMPTIVSTESDMPTIVSTESDMPTIVSSESFSPTGSASFTPSISPVAGGVPSTPTIALQTSAPSRGELAPSSGSDNDAAKNFGWVTFAGVFLVAIVFAWRGYACCRRRREQRMLDERSAQADRVLGDMQMLPREDMDLL
jgi:hypothetical protein